MGSLLPGLGSYSVRGVGMRKKWDGVLIRLIILGKGQWQDVLVDMRKFEHLTHRGNIKDGKLVLNNPKWFKGMLQMYSDADVVVTLERKKNSKSKEQQGYYWGIILQYISEYTGQSPEDLHDIFKAKYLRRKKLWRGADMVTIGSTSRLSANEMSEFMQNVILEGNELGIEIPPPDPEYQWR